MATGSRLQQLLRQLLQLEEPPWRTALAFAVGVFLTFSPPYGLHMVLAVACAWAFRLNMVAVVAGLCVNTPWTLVPALGLTLWLGCVLLGMPFPTVDWTDTSASGIFHQMFPYAIPFVLGGTILSLVGGLVAYPVAYWILTHWKRRRSESSEDPPLPPRTDIR